jgi:DNA polymerase
MSKHTLYWDVETRSTLDLKKVGTHVYAAHPTTAMICLAWAIDNEPVRLWRAPISVWAGDPVPPEFFEAAANPDWTTCAHNAAFESVITRHILHPRHGFPLVPPERHRCTMAACLASALPAKLGAVADALGLVHRKDAAGERLMHQMSKPRRPHKDEDPFGLYWFNDEERLQRLGEYCKQDVEVERELDGRLPPLSDSEQVLWLLSNLINDRGFHIDRRFAEAARQIAKAAAPEIDVELVEITDGAVIGINQIERMKGWLRAQGCMTPALDRGSIEKLLENGELALPVRRVLELRLDGAQAAIKKIDALLARAGADNRVRGAFRYHGASTGRWAGEGPQPQNLKRPEVKDIDAAIKAVATGDYQLMKRLFPKPLAVVGDCTRSMITATPGYVLIVADFSSIESRILAWLAGEEWKLDAYRHFDASQDPRSEPYLVTACRIFRVPDGTFTKESPERKIGKTCDLAFGYQGALGAWRNFEPDQFTDAEVEQFKREWRDAHPKIVQFWRDIDRAAVSALCVRDNSAVSCGRLKLECAGMFLRIELPSRRLLSYPMPRLTQDDRGRHHVVYADNGAGQFKDCRNGQGAYGGVWTENIVSAIARDLLAEAMLRIEAAGYRICLHVHDEVVAEVPAGSTNIKEFVELMTRNPIWAPDLPIAANAWTGPRYRK